MGGKLFSGGTWEESFSRPWMALMELSLGQSWEGEAPALACSLHQRGLGLLHEQSYDVWSSAALPLISSPRKLASGAVTLT